MGPERVMFVVTGLNTGGAEMQILRVVSQLDRSLIEPVVVSILRIGRIGDLLRSRGVSVYSLDIPRERISAGAILISSCRLFRLVARYRPRTLVSFMYHANILSRVVGWVAGVPRIITSIRNSNFGGRARDLSMRVTSWMDDQVIINSRMAGQEIVQRHVVPANKLSVIPNGIRLEDYQRSREIRQQARSALKLTETEFAWLAVGRLERQKDYPNLLRAFAVTVVEEPDARLFIAGEGPLRSSLQGMVAELELGKYVDFLGLRTDIPDLLAAADAFVLSSQWEGLPNVVIEAMAARLPVVATDAGGTAELVLSECTGWVVPARDHESLSERMLAMMALGQEERAEMGAAGCIHIQEHFELSQVARKWEECCRAS